MLLVRGVDGSISACFWRCRRVSDHHAVGAARVCDPWCLASDVQRTCPAPPRARALDIDVRSRVCERPLRALAGTIVDGALVDRRGDFSRGSVASIEGRATRAAAPSASRAIDRTPDRVDALPGIRDRLQSSELAGESTRLRAGGALVPSTSSTWDTERARAVSPSADVALDLWVVTGTWAPRGGWMSTSRTVDEHFADGG